MSWYFVVEFWWEVTFMISHPHPLLVGFEVGLGGFDEGGNNRWYDLTMEA